MIPVLSPPWLRVSTEKTTWKKLVRQNTYFSVSILSFFTFVPKHLKSDLKTPRTWQIEGARMGLAPVRT